VQQRCAGEHDATYESGVLRSQNGADAATEGVPHEDEWTVSSELVHHGGKQCGIVTRTPGALRGWRRSEARQVESDRTVSPCRQLLCGGVKITGAT
jgi:hypothetical protein